MVYFKGKKYNCHMEMAMDLIGGKWKVLILWHLAEKVLRFNELKRLFPEVTQKMLTQQLKDLEENGLINRKVYAQVPPKVEYSLTDFGKTLMPVLYSLNQWGREYSDEKQLIEK
ncbi:MAG: helix-turn-helix transcriptional regulator [Clostridia bacterium]|nr:helix-turn-helix transcriptional regulator [Clostridia bacterium]